MKSLLRLMMVVTFCLFVTSCKKEEATAEEPAVDQPVAEQPAEKAPAEADPKAKDKEEATAPVSTETP